MAAHLDLTTRLGGIVLPQTPSGATISVEAMVPQDGGTFMVLGNTTEDVAPLYLIRYDPAGGNTQTTHVADARLGMLQQRHFAQQSTGKVLLAGMTDASFVVARLNTDGTLDSTFGSGGLARRLH